MKRIAVISLLWLLASCSKSDVAADQTASIASLRNYDTNYRSMLITDNITVEGYVTANDKYGEFSNCLIIEDSSAALKIMCEIDQSYQLYPFGSKVKVSCSGLYLINHYGSITLGAEPTGDYTLDYISQSRLGQYVKTTTESSDQLIEANDIEISELTPLYAYSYVELSNVKISNELGIETFCDRNIETGRTVDTSHTITDSAGLVIELYVDQLCSYADAQLPTGSCQIKGIVDYYNGEYSITITNCDYKTVADL